jgi:antitoxin component YwqK of YwqJK toxin-antitoxin module
MRTLFAIIISISFANAQAPKENIIAYFDKKWQVVKDPATATYYRTVEQRGEKYLVRHYFMSGELQMEAECGSYKSGIVYNGKRVTYYANGNPKAQEFFQNNVEYGTHHTFYANGKPQKDVTFNNGKRKIDRFYSPEGDDLLVNGNAIVQDTVFGKGAAFREIIDHKEVSAFYIEKMDTIYVQCNQSVDYKGGMERYAKDIVAEVEYPAIAKELKLEGVVYIVIRISKSGNIVKTTLMRGFDHSCNMEALRVIKGLDFWIAAQHHHKPVTSEIIVPVDFRLKGKTDVNFLMAIGRELLKMTLIY